jgi:hypothetical protein
MAKADLSSHRHSNLGNIAELYHHTVPILNYDRAQPDLVGTGVFVGVDQYSLVATAAHVLEEAFRKIAFGFLTAGQFEVFGDQNMRILKAEAQSGSGNIRRVVYKDGLDIAIIEPTAAVLEKLHSHYTPFNLRQNPDSPEANWGVVSGWPARKNAYDRKTRSCDFDSCYHIQCPFADERKLCAAGWNTDIYIGLSANKSKDFVSETSGKRIQLPKLEGMSGGGFWLPSPSDGSCGDPDWRLAGIIVEDDEPRRMLKAIKIEHLWTALGRGWRLRM